VVAPDQRSGDRTLVAPRRWGVHCWWTQLCLRSVDPFACGTKMCLTIQWLLSHVLDASIEACDMNTSLLIAQWFARILSMLVKRSSQKSSMKLYIRSTFFRTVSPRDRVWCSLRRVLWAQSTPLHQRTNARIKLTYKHASPSCRLRSHLKWCSQHSLYLRAVNACVICLHTIWEARRSGHGLQIKVGGLLLDRRTAIGNGDEPSSFSARPICTPACIAPSSFAQIR